MAQKLVSIRSGEFIFCRYAVAILVWLAIIFSSKEIVLLVFGILLLSAILTVRYAPMILLWRYTFGLVIKTKSEVLNVKAMRFAHLIGATISGVCLLFLYFGNPIVGWVFVGFLAIMKTISAFGFCPASKLYVCMLDGGCCALTKKR